ncbi:TRAP transporter substrate-binding protein [Oceanibacterium hippocampi]|uniref:2,3-diketo-L-gulonate-binding periplasmic protein YiaO n=1 Tax=Oceanibacterium hippocampi TaxID=745714 RepID=A0A1Y5TXR9_9PROT|nr:TRAP transporter substrate-binding protein [Oceanibacterium hippocampi]SLN75307.1 2,3-diketo-L-gulonate-binding periplasmic protein YiaO precursor [Oceanibacterium hippocampi]
MGHFRLSGVVAAAMLVALPASAETLRLGSGFQAGHSSAKAVEEIFTPALGKIDGMDFKVQNFPGLQLGSAEEIIQQTRDGTIFGAYISSAYFNSYVAELGALNLPFAFPSREVAFEVLDGSVRDLLAEKLKAEGFRLLGVMELGFRHVTNSAKPVTTPDDLKGMSIRLQPNPIHMETFRTLGANAVALDASELFAALEQKVVDGQENPYAVIDLYKIYESQQYVTDTAHFFDVILFVASENVMAGFPQEVQDAIAAAARATTLRQREIAASEDGEHKRHLAELGMQITELTDAQRALFREAVAPVYQKMRTQIGEAYVDEFLAAIDRASGN